MERIKDRNFVAGIKQTKKAIQRDEADFVYIACDAAEFATEPVKLLCAEHKTELSEIATMKELAKACGVDVPTAAVALLKDA